MMQITQPGYIPAMLHEQRRKAEMDARAARMRQCWDYYEGRHPDTLSVRRGQPDDNTVVNLARQIVDKGVSMLFGRGVTWQVDENRAARSPVEVYLDAVWDANDRNAKLADLALNGAICGIAALKVLIRPAGPRLVVLDPAYVDITTDEEDIDEVTRYCIQYTVDRKGAEVHRRQEIVRDGDGWLITDSEAVGWVAVWRPLGEPVRWPYPIPPVIHCKNLPNPNSVWGYSDLEDVTLNDAINGVVSSSRKIVRLHGFPQTIVKGTSITNANRGPDQIWQDIPKDGDVYNLEMRSDLGAARQLYLDLRSAMYAQGRMPDMANVGNLGALTNFGLRVLFADALERTEIKRQLYGGLIRRTNALLAMIGGYGDAMCTLTWPDALPVNQDEVTRIVAQQQVTGLVSRETLTTVLGYDYADEQQRLMDEGSDEEDDDGPDPTARGAAGADQPAAGDRPGAEPASDDTE